MSTVLVIGVGDMDERLATGLAGHLGVRRLLLAGRSAAKVAEVAATVVSGHDCAVESVPIDATRADDVATLLGRPPARSGGAVRVTAQPVGPGRTQRPGGAGDRLGRSRAGTDAKSTMCYADSGSTSPAPGSP